MNCVYCLRVEEMDERVDVGDDGLQGVGCPREAEMGIAPRSRESSPGLLPLYGNSINKAQQQSLYMLCSRITYHSRQQV